MAIRRVGAGRAVFQPSGSNHEGTLRRRRRSNESAARVSIDLGDCRLELKHVVTRSGAIDTASSRVRRAASDLGVEARVRDSVIADAAAQVAACEVALRSALARFPEPGELAPPISTGSAK